MYDDAVEDAKRDPYIGQKAADKYVIVARISEGGMGTVYRTLQLPVEREVAFKVLRTELEDNDEVRNRFIREARAVSKINHPNIITLHDFGFDDSEYPYMVMEYAPGQGLDEWIYEKDITLDRVVHVLRQILSALAEAHEQGVVHRDLKPENIMVTGTGTDDDFIKLLDFGIARLVNEQATEGLTREGEVFGTPHYMSPEQAEGETGIGPPADVYALGIMLYELLCAECPFDAPKPLSILFKQINEELPPLSPRSDMVVPQPLENLLRKATAKKPEARYQTAGEMLEALERIDDPDRSGIVQVANDSSSSKQTQRGIGEQQPPPAEQQQQQPEGRDSYPSRQEMATANTLGFEGTEDGTSPPGDASSDSIPPPNGGAGAGHSNDVSVDEPKDSLFGLEDADQGEQQQTIIALIAILALVLVAGFSALLMLGGEGESAAASGGDSDSEKSAEQAVTDNAKGDEASGETVADSPDSGLESGSEDAMVIGSNEDVDAESADQDDREPADDPAGGADDSPRADQDDSNGRESGSAGESGGSGSESATGGNASSTTGGGRDEESTSPTYDPDPDPDPDPPPTSGSEFDSTDDDDDDDGEIEKFGAPSSGDEDEEEDDPDKFDDPSKFGAPE